MMVVKYRVSYIPMIELILPTVGYTVFLFSFT